MKRKQFCILAALAIVFGFVGGMLSSSLVGKDAFAQAGETLRIGERSGDAKAPATKLEAFTAERGKLIVKEFYQVGSEFGKGRSRTTLKTLVTYETGHERDKRMGILATVRGTSEEDPSETSFLDFEEAKSLSKSLVYMIKVLHEWSGTEKMHTEVIYRTEGGFEIGIYQKGTQQVASVASGRLNTQQCFFQLPHIPAADALVAIKTLLDKGIERLESR